MERMSLFCPLQFKTTSVRLDSNFFFSLNWSQNDDGYSCDVCEETTKDSCSVSIFNCYVTTLMKVKVASDVIVHVGFP